MSDEFSFRTSHAMQTLSDILFTQQAIRDTLSSIDTSLQELRPHWEASESDQYQEIMAKWSEGARGLADVLTEVRNALRATRNGNTEVRAGIQAVLDETS